MINAVNDINAKNILLSGRMNKVDKLNPLNPVQNFLELEKKPGKLVNFFVKYLDNEEEEKNSFQKKILDAACETLLEKYNNKKLSDYHLVKWISRNPAFLKGKEELLLNGLNGFKREFCTNVTDPKTLKRVGKIHVWFKEERFQSEKIQNPFKVSLRSSDGQNFQIDALNWATKIPSIVSKVLMDDPPMMEFTKEMLSVLEHFVKEGKLPDIENKKLIQFFSSLYKIQDADFRTCYVNRLINAIDNKNYLDILKVGLIAQEEKLILACIQHMDTLKIPLKMVWSKIGGLIIEVTGFVPEVRRILKARSRTLKKMKFPSKEIKHLIENEMDFPELSYLELLGDEQIPKEQIGKIKQTFPKVQKCCLSSKTLMGIEGGENPWDKLESMVLRDHVELSFFKKIETAFKFFPNLKLIQINSNTICDEVNKKEGVLILAMNRARKVLDLSSVSEYVTDKIVFDLIVSCPNIHTLNLSGCGQITDNIGNQISKLTQLKKLNLKGCTKLTDSSGGEICKELKGLEELFLEGNFSDATGDAIKRNLQNLKTLHLSGSFTEGIEEGIKKNLQSLSNSFIMSKTIANSIL